MGRPINKKYFGNRNTGSSNTTSDDYGIGGEGVASVTISGSWSGFTQATSTVTFSAPQLPGGVTATGTVTITAGAPASVTITNSGSGYTTAPTVTIADSDGGAETTGTATAVLTSSQENAIRVYAKTTSGGTRQVGDIIAQKGSKKFRVITADGTSTCALRTDGSSGVDTMDITAYDSDNGEYWVLKLTAHKAVLVVKGVGGGSQFATGQVVPWNMTGGVAGVSVKIDNK